MEALETHAALGAVGGGGPPRVAVAGGVGGEGPLDVGGDGVHGGRVEPAPEVEEAGLPEEVVDLVRVVVGRERPTEVEGCAVAVDERGVVGSPPASPRAGTARRSPRRSGRRRSGRPCAGRPPMKKVHSDCCCWANDENSSGVRSTMTASSAFPSTTVRRPSSSSSDRTSPATSRASGRVPSRARPSAAGRTVAVEQLGPPVGEEGRRVDLDHVGVVAGAAVDGAKCRHGAPPGRRPHQSTSPTARMVGRGALRAASSARCGPPARAAAPTPPRPVGRCP